MAAQNCSAGYPPIRTVTQPGGMILPVGPGIGATQEGWDVMSPTRAAGRPPTSTAKEPSAIMAGPPGTQPASMQGVVVSETRAAGWPPISTVGVPLMIVCGSGACGCGVGTGAAGWIGAWQCGASFKTMSPMRAAGFDIKIGCYSGAAFPTHRDSGSSAWRIAMEEAEEKPEEKTELDETGRVRHRFHLLAGRPHGESVLFGERGEVLRKQSFVDGQLDGEWAAWDEDGWIAERGRFQAGLLEGELLRYDRDGRVEAALSYRAGKLDGEALFYDAGRLQVKIAYRDGLQDGETVLFDENGQTTARTLYHRGQPQPAFKKAP